MQPREPILQNGVFYEKDGVTLLEGRRNLMIHDDDSPHGFKVTEYYYKDGKIHGSPGIFYHDGRMEKWEDGRFIEEI
jgi:hypothetical protein